jgi:predicted ATPase/DNA-binding CsgD family transcriptional regulator
MTAQTVITDGNLPAEPNSFIGRKRDLAELARLLVDVRALTLCGPGGIGKTRLALRLACEVVPNFPDGAWLAELADTRDPSMVLPRIAAVLGVREERGRPLAETLTDTLRPRQLLLILDTCEHVVNPCAALVQQLLAGCPGLRVITTSREPLRVRGETVWRVPPLELPGLAAEFGTGELARNEAARLFAERAAAARPGFVLHAANAAAVARLCCTLDGIPLAIELAAARVGALSVEQIAARVGDRFQLLATGDRTAPQRQQTLRAAVDWSYELLTGPEQVLLRRLAVFSGWNLEMAEHVCADDVIPADRVLDLLAALVDKSLVTLDAEVEGDARYRLLDTIKEYAADRLNASGEELALRQRHRDNFLRMIESIVDRAFGRGDPAWPERVSLYRKAWAERDNLRAVLSFCLEHGDADHGLRLCSGLRSPWVVHGDVAEGVSWLDRFLSMDGDVSPQVRARAMALRAELAFEQQDYALASDSAEAAVNLVGSLGTAGSASPLRLLALVSLRAGRHEEALARADAAVQAAQADADIWEGGLALATRALIIARQGRLDEAQRVFYQALDVLRDNNRWGSAQTRYGLGHLAAARGDHAAALLHFRDALAVYRILDARPDMARALAGIGSVALAEGDLGLASSSMTESLQLSLATGQRLAIARGLEAYAALAIASGDPAGSARLAGTARALRRALGQDPAARPGADDLLGPARRELGAEATAALLAEGEDMSPLEAFRLAAAGSAGHSPGSAGHGGPAQEAPQSGSAGTLTARELQITTLIARGLSNRGIADELVISPATAARHVANIFSKLGFSSRAQVAAWVAQLERHKG